MSNFDFTRRQFLKTSALAIVAIPAVGLATRALAAPKGKKAAPLPAGMTEVPATDAVAMAIGYKANVKDIDYTKYPQRKKPEAKNQLCNNCALYTTVNDSWGKCQMMPSGVVAAQGWCGSWSKKA